MKEAIEEIIKNNNPEIATQKILKLVVKPDVISRSSWFCNECNFSDYTDAVTEEELDKWLQCSNCGGNEFHLEKNGL